MQFYVHDSKGHPGSLILGFFAGVETSPSKINDVEYNQYTISYERISSRGISQVFCLNGS